MHVTPLHQDLIPDVIKLMEQGPPYISPRTASDYWLYAHLFASSCPVALIDGEVVGAVMAFRSQEDPEEVYVQDVMTSPGHRRLGVAKTLLEHVRLRAVTWGCSRVYLTSEPENTGAQATWLSLGFHNVPGEMEVNGVSVCKDFKGPGKHRAVYQLLLS